MLSARLRELEDAGVIARASDAAYSLTLAGRELEGAVRELGTWGQRWLPRTLPREELDASALLWDMRRRVRLEALPAAPLVMRVDLTDAGSVHYFLLRRSEASLCAQNPGFPEELRLAASLRTLTSWWRGDISLAAARSEGLVVEGRREHVRAFPGWFERYLFANVAPAR
jgi:hypothetical protein